MSVSLTDKNDVFLLVRGNHKDGILVPADVQSLALAYGVELRPVVTADNLSIGILLVARLLDVLLSAAVGLGLKTDVVGYRFGQTE